MVEAQQIILAAWVALALALAGLGALVQRLWTARVSGAAGWLRCFWLGWATLTLAAQLWHFAFPIDDRALAAVALAGALGLVIEGRRPWLDFARGARAHLPALILLAAAAAWLSNRALAGASNGDTGYYYVPTIVWLRSYAIVPGLANLSAPLAYNQTYFHYVALLETGPFVHASHHIANGVLLLALFARGLLGASRFLRRGGAAPDDAFYMVFLPVAVQMGFSMNLTSPAPDFLVFVFGVVLAGELIAFLSRRGDVTAGLCALAVLATAATTVKLTLAGLAAPTFLVAFCVAAWRGAGVRALAAAAALAVVWIVPWLAGNVVLSGYPLYPSGLAGFPVSWRVPEDVSRLIRDANSLHGSIVAAWRDPRWFLTSLDSLGWYTGEVLVPLGMAAAALVVGPPLWFVRRRAPSGPRMPALALVPVVVALVFWFWAAPRPRFAGAALWLLGMEAVLLALGSAIASRAGRGVLAVLAASLAVVVFHNGGPLLRRDLNGLEPTSSRTTLHEKVLASGLVVSVAENMACWYAPLPCTPEAHPGLRLRQAGNLGAGFVIDAPAPP